MRQKIKNKTGRPAARKFIRLVLTWTLMLALPLLATGCAGQRIAGRRIVFTTGFSRDELFTVGDASATTAQFRVYFVNLQREYEKTFGSTIWTNAGNETLVSDVKDNALARLSKVKVLNLMAGDAGLGLDESEQAKAQQAADTYYASLNDAERTYLDVDADKILEMYQDYALAQKEYEAIIGTVDTEISDDEARSVTCQQIRILSANYETDADAQAKATSILQEIRDGMANLTGVTFDTYISEYNEAAASEITISRQSGETAMEEAAFSLDVGKISDVIQTSDGYVILKCIEGYNAEQTQANKQTILAQRQETTFETTYDNYVQDIDYNIDQQKYQAIGLVTDPQITTATFFTTYESVFAQ